MASRLLNFYKCRRAAWRVRVENKQEAIVEFDLPAGRHHTLRLVEISEGGLSFHVDDAVREALTIGMDIDDVTVDVGGLQIVGSMRLLHVTEPAGGGAACGVEFTPTTGVDERMMGLVLLGLEHRSSQPR